MAKSTLREQLDDATADLAETRTALETLIDTVKRDHEDTHAGVFRYCTNETCRVAGLLEYDAESRIAL